MVSGFVLTRSLIGCCGVVLEEGKQQDKRERSESGRQSILMNLSLCVKRRAP